MPPKLKFTREEIIQTALNRSRYRPGAGEGFGFVSAAGFRLISEYGRGSAGGLEGFGKFVSALSAERDFRR